MTQYYLQLILALSIFLTVLYVVYKWAKIVQARRFSGDLKLLDRLALDNHVSICVVGNKDKRYLFGVTGKSLELLESSSCKDD